MAGKARSAFTAHGRRHGARAHAPGRTDFCGDVAGSDTSGSVRESRPGIRDRVLPDSLRICADALASRPRRSTRRGAVPHEMNSRYKFGGGALAASGVLFAVLAFLNFQTGPPPSNGAAILLWRDSQVLILDFVSEFSFFATV